MAKGEEDEALTRKQRLARQLRANLKKRKIQQRKREKKEEKLSKERKN